MAIYEYKCDGCDEEFEFWQNISDHPKTECPKCGGKLRKLISVSNFHLKGKGWYATDYKNSGKENK